MFAFSVKSSVKKKSKILLNFKVNTKKVRYEIFASLRVL